MEKEDIRTRVADMLNKGMSLSDIQKELQANGASMTFLELRLLASELQNIDWAKQDPAPAPKPAAEKKAAPADDADAEDFADAEIEDDADAEADAGGQAVVELNKIQRPGAVMSGSVKFPSGASADWALDNYGRLGLENAKGKPTQDDLMAFQRELQKKLSRGRY